MTFLEKIKQYFSKPDLVILRQDKYNIVASIGTRLISINGLSVNTHISVDPNPAKLISAREWLARKYPRYYHLLLKMHLTNQKLKERYTYGEV